MHVLILVLFYCKTYSRTRISYSKKWWKFHVLEKGFSIERKKKKKEKRKKNYAPRVVFSIEIQNFQIKLVKFLSSLVKKKKKNFYIRD